MRVISYTETQFSNLSLSPFLPEWFRPCSISGCLDMSKTLYSLISNIRCLMLSRTEETCHSRKCMTEPLCKIS